VRDALLVRGDTRALPLADNSVDLIVTSPPYYAQRSYRDGEEHYDGQVGDEPSPGEYVEALLGIAHEWWRVLRPSGNCFVNLGDKRENAGGHRRGTPGVSAREGRASAEEWVDRSTRRTGFVRLKSKMLLPHRFAIGCADGDGDPDGVGWLVRQDIVWDKQNPMPESVRDRARDSHEYWFHLAKGGDHYSAVDEVREPHVYPDDLTRHLRGTRNRDPDGSPAGGSTTSLNPLGRAPGSVWRLPSEPLIVPEWLKAETPGVEHYATFPSEWPRRLILGWSPPGICLECGQGREPIVEKRLELDHVQGRNNGGGRRDLGEPEGNERGMNGEHPNGSTVATIVGYSCACTPYTDYPERRRGRQEGTASDERATGGTRLDPDQDWPERLPVREYHLDGWTPPPTRPAVVLDPFGGSGTTAMCARALGRVGISLDLSASYLRLAEWRVFESGGAAKVAARTERSRQVSLF